MIGQNWAFNGCQGDAPKFRNKHHHISPAMAPHLQLLLDACCGQQLAADFQCCSELAGVASGSLFPLAIEDCHL